MIKIPHIDIVLIVFFLPFQDFLYHMPARSSQHHDVPRSHDTVPYGRPCTSLREDGRTSRQQPATWIFDLQQKDLLFHQYITFMLWPSDDRCFVVAFRFTAAVVNFFFVISAIIHEASFRVTWKCCHIWWSVQPLWAHAFTTRVASRFIVKGSRIVRAGEWLSNSQAIVFIAALPI